MHLSSLPRRPRELGLWLLLGLGAVYFARILFFRQTLYFRDLYLLYLPQKALVADHLRALDWPLWNEFLHGGIPLLADISNSALYPTNLLYLLLPHVRAFNLDMVLHVVAASLAAYLLARQLGLRQGPSVLVALTYAYCGYALSLVNLLVVHLARPYLPLMLLTWHRFLTQGRHPWFVATVLLGGLQVLAGGPEMVAFTHASLLVWGVGISPGWRKLRRCLLGWLLASLLVVFLAAVQLLPTVELVAASARGQGMTYDDWSSWSLPPRRLPELLVPGFLGPTHTLNESDYWGAGLVHKGFPYILSLYFGLPLLVLAGVGTASKNGSVPRRLRYWLAALALGCLVFSLGRSLPFFELVFHAVPPAHLFRFPIKLLNLAVLPVALLAGLGVEALARHPPAHLARWLGIGATLVGALSVLLLAAPGLGQRLMTGYFSSPLPQESRGLALALGHTAVFSLAAALVLAAQRRHGRHLYLHLLVAVVAVDLLTAGRTVNPPAPDPVLTQVPDLVRPARGAVGAGRLYRTQDSGGTVPAPTNDGYWRYRYHLDNLAFYLGAFYRIPVIFHVDYHGLAPNRVMALGIAVESLPWRRRQGLLSASGVSLVATREELPVPPFEAVGEATAKDPGAVRLYRNPGVAPRVRFVTIWQAVSSDQEALRAMSHPNFDPRLHAVIQGAKGNSPPRRCEPASVSAGAETRRTRYVRVRNSCGGYVVFQERLYPGWKVKVDGEPAPQRAADLAFSAVYLDPGEHRVERYFAPGSVLWGAVLSLATLIFLVAWPLLRRGLGPSRGVSG